MIKNKTIVAIATPSGVGALALMRLSGTFAFQIFSNIITEKEKFAQAPNRLIKQYFIIESKTQKIIDEVTAIKYKAPHSFTGENIVEIISHGGTFTVKNIVEQLLQFGAEIAERGEFSKRAFLNGKIDLMKAEAAKALIESKNESEYLSAINLYTGFYKKLLDWQEQIQQEITFCEAEIEFGEAEEITGRSETAISEIKNKIQDELNRIKSFKEIKNGLNIVIGGLTNAGKSSLFNYLAGYKRAIVHESPGTTRDSISIKIEFNDMGVNVFDTAGFRTTSDCIENEGIQISKNLLLNAHLILWITDISENKNTEEINILNSFCNKKIILLYNKIDKKINIQKLSLLNKVTENSLKISIKDEINLKKMMTLIKNEISQIYEKNNPPDIFVTKRHEILAKKINFSLKKAIKNWNQKEIASYYLRESLIGFEEINGKIDNDKIINQIFDSFCIGK